MDISAKLLKFYLENDNNIMLEGQDFNVAIKLSVIKCFVPVMKASLETKINESQNKTHITLSHEWDKETVNVFVRILQDKTFHNNISWSLLVKLLRFSHFYQAEEVVKFCYKKGENRIPWNTLIEAVQLTDVYMFEEWDDQIVYLIKTYPGIRKDANWKKLFVEHPITMSRIVSKMFEK